MSNQERTRTVTWQDPLVGAKAALKMSGLQFIQAMINGEFPPPPILAAHGLRLAGSGGRTGRIWLFAC